MSDLNIICINSDEVESWIFDHAQIQGHIVDGFKGADGINIKWVDRETKESIDVIWEGRL